jgi:DNA-binding response OmpR family regulator
VKQRVLIADDDPSIVLSLEFLLERAGYDVRVAGDGETTLAEVRHWQPDILLLDVMLPARSGLDVCRLLRSDARWDRMKIVMLTARGQAAEIAQGLSLGADRYVTKPFGTRELLATLRCLFTP